MENIILFAENCSFVEIATVIGVLIFIIIGSFFYLIRWHVFAAYIHNITGCKQKLENLATHKQLLQAIIDNMPSFVYVFDLNGRCILLNEKLAKFFNTSVDDAIGQTREAWIPDKTTVQKHLDNDQQVITTKKPLIVEETTQEPDGVHTYLSGKFPIFDADGNIYAVGGISTDVTDHKRSEEEIKLNKAKLEAALASMSDAVYISDSQGQFIEFNESFATFHKFSNKQTCPNALKDYPRLIDVYSIDGGFLPLEQRPVSRALRGETGVDVELALKRKDTGENWIGSYNYAPIRNDNGSIIGSVVTARDITERKKVEQSLLESEEKFRMLVENSPLFIAIYSGNDNAIQYINQCGLNVCGYSLEELPNVEAWYQRAYPNPDYRKLLVAEWDRRVSIAVQTKSAIQPMEAEVTCKDGSTKTLEWGFVSLGDINIAYGHDITERKKAESKLQDESERLKVILETVGSPIFVKDNQHRIVLANHAFFDMFNLDEKAVIGKTLAEEVTPAERQHFLQIDRQVLDTGIPNVCEETFTTKNRETRIIVTRKSRFVENTGQKFLVGSIHDITEYKKAQEALIASEKEFRLLAEAMPQIVWVTRSDGWNIYFNWQWIDYTGLTLEESYGHGWNMPFHPNDKQRAWDAWQNAVNNRGIYSLECQLRRYDGVYRWWLIRGVPALDEDGKVYKWFGTCTDIHEIKETEKTLREKERLLSDSQTIAHVGSWAVDIDTGTFKWSEETFRLYGQPITDQTLMLENFFELLHPDDILTMRNWVDDCLSGKQPTALEFRTRPIDGKFRWLQGNGILETDSTGKPLRIIGTVQDITERKKAEETIYEMAFYDPLTKLPNRRLMLDRLNQALLSRILKQRYGAVLLINLDNFKQVNDSKGHQVGDLLLLNVSKYLQASLHEEDTLARIGSDEFVILIEGLDTTIDRAAVQAEAVAKRILTILNLPQDLQGYEYRCNASIGITLFHAHADSGENLLKQVDIAMHQAKRHGNNSICFFDFSIQSALDFRVQLELGMHKAVKEQYRLYYQMQVDIKGNITGAETLIRWQHPEQGLISPAAFIPLAEETGLILSIGRWVLETACQQLKKWSKHPKTCDLILAVNVSAKQFQQSDFVKQVLAILAQTGANPNRLKLELTESMLVDNVEDIIKKMNVLRNKNVRFSLDDFGTGFSSLTYLKRLPLNQLKIDQSFVQDALTDPSDAAIIRTIIALGQSLGMDVIAEGVETKEHRDFLADYGCHHYQGYFFSKPLPLEEFEKALFSNSADRLADS